MKVEHVKVEKGGYFSAEKDDRNAGRINYSRSGDGNIIIEHTEVNSEFQGQGVGQDLVKNAVEFARENNFKIISQCSYAKKILGRNSDYEDVLI